MDMSQAKALQQAAAVTPSPPSEPETTGRRPPGRPRKSSLRPVHEPKLPPRPDGRIRLTSTQRTLLVEIGNRLHLLRTAIHHISADRDLETVVAKNSRRCRESWRRWWRYVSTSVKAVCGRRRWLE
jgi:hypothetical protein